MRKSQDERKTRAHYLCLQGNSSPSLSSLRAVAMIGCREGSASSSMASKCCTLTTFTSFLSRSRCNREKRTRGMHAATGVLAVVTYRSHHARARKCCFIPRHGTKAGSVSFSSSLALYHCSRVENKIRLQPHFCAAPRHTACSRYVVNCDGCSLIRRGTAGYRGNSDSTCSFDRATLVCVVYGSACASCLYA